MQGARLPSSLIVTTQVYHCYPYADISFKPPCLLSKPVITYVSMVDI